MDITQLTQIAADTVGAAQRQLPPELRKMSRGAVVHYQRAPAPDLVASGCPTDTLGFFMGPVYGEEAEQLMPEPSQILLFLDNLWVFAERDPGIFRDEVRVTYLHELGHYLGWDEDDLAARGLD
jgi:predicted Zn-dependent protease with MMP-like domain